jgi:hypothetical protein
MQRFVIPAGLLRSHPKESILLMRLGALANAVLSVMSMSSGALAAGMAQQRDTLQMVLLMVSYLNEAIETIDNQYCWPLIQAGVDAGYRFSKPLPEIRELFSRKRGSVYKEVIFDVRRTKGFHVDEKHFVEWLDKLNAPDVTLWRKDSPSPLEWTFTASGQIQSFFGTKLNDAHMLALQDAVFLPNLVEAMAIGLLARSRLNPGDAFRSTSLCRVNVEFDFSDGRPNFCTTHAVEVDDNGDLSGSVAVLRDLVTLTFGGRRVGAVLPGADCDIAFSSPRGTARGFLGARIADRVLTDPQALQMMRARQMAHWGVVRTRQILTYLDSVRTGAATAQKTEKLIAECRSDLEFWREREHEIEQITATQRDQPQ